LTKNLASFIEPRDTIECIDVIEMSYVRIPIAVLFAGMAGIEDTADAVFMPK